MSQFESEDSHASIEQDLLGMYINEAKRTPLLNAEQEVELSKRIEAGLYAATILDSYQMLVDSGEADTLSAEDEILKEELEWIAQDGKEAKDHFLSANLLLVIWQANKLKRHGDSMTDLVQEGNLGLIRAVEKFDYTKGYKFSTYAPWWIRQQIGRGMANIDRTVKLPMEVIYQINSINKAERLLEGYGIETSPEQLAKETGIDVDRVYDLLEWRQGSVSLDAPIGDEGEGTVLDVLELDTESEGPEANILSVENTETLEQLLSELDERDTQIIRRRFGLEDGRRHMFKDIARDIGVSAERVRQLERKILNRLRASAPRDEY